MVGQAPGSRKTTVSPKRRALLGLVHKGAAKMFGDDHEAYEDWLERETGKRSCKQGSRMRFSGYDLCHIIVVPGGFFASGLEGCFGG